MELDPVMSTLAPMRALVGHESRMDPIPLIEDTAATNPVAYSEESTMVGVHILGEISTNVTRASEGTELTLKT